MSEVEITYRDGPLDGERDLCEDWELADGEPGSRDGDVWDHPEVWTPDGSAPVHRYRLRRVNAFRWEYRYVGRFEWSGAGRAHGAAPM